MSAEITMTVKQLEEICQKQRTEVANYLTGNLSNIGDWWDKIPDLSKAKGDIKARAISAPLPDDVRTLKKYLKP